MTSVSSFPYLITLAIITITCICVLHLVCSEDPSFWKLMPKGERDEYGKINQGELTFGHLEIYICMFIMSMFYIAEFMNYIISNYV
jgi:hypothetical protein